VTESAQSGLDVGTQCYVRAMGRRFLVTVLGLSEDTLWVSFPPSDYPIAGMGVDVEVHDDQGFSCYHTRVAIGPRGTTDGMVLQRSGGVHYLRHRRSWRVPIKLAVSMDMEDGRSFRGTLLNLSAEGALIETTAALQVGDGLTVTVALPGVTVHRINARVIREEAPAGPARLLQVGLWFTDMPAEARRALTVYLWKRMRELYPAELHALYPMSRR